LTKKRKTRQARSTQQLITQINNPTQTNKTNKQSYHHLVYYAANITHEYITELGKKERKKNKAREAAAAADDHRLEDKAEF